MIDKLKTTIDSGFNKFETWLNSLSDKFWNIIDKMSNQEIKESHIIANLPNKINDALDGALDGLLNVISPQK